jgi:multidrug efflux system membrane fusion protein
MRPVEVQLTDGDQAVIARGLSAGDVVVIDGVDKLQEGSKVSVRQPDQKRPAAKSPSASPNGAAKGASPRSPAAPASPTGGQPEGRI